MQLLAFPRGVQCCWPHGLQAHSIISDVREITKRFQTKRTPKRRVEPQQFMCTLVMERFQVVHHGIHEPLSECAYQKLLVTSAIFHKMQ